MKFHRTWVCFQALNFKLLELLMVWAWLDSIYPYIWGKNYLLSCAAFLEHQQTIGVLSSSSLQFEGLISALHMRAKLPLSCAVSFSIFNQQNPCSFILNEWLMLKIIFNPCFNFHVGTFAEDIEWLYKCWIWFKIEQLRDSVDSESRRHPPTKIDIQCS